MDFSYLEHVGLTKGEIKVYVALLEIGTSSTGPIITRSKVTRSKVYDILEKLKDKGLISEFFKENARYFQALSPEKINDYLKSKETLIKNQQTEFKKILPILLAKQKIKQSEHQVRVYHGFEGIKALYIEMSQNLKNTDEYLGFSFPPEALKHKPVLWIIDNFHRKRSEKGAKAKILCTKKDTVNASKLKHPKNKLYEYRISKHPFPQSISIFQDSVATFLWEEVPRVFVIKSKEVSDHYKIFFNTLWVEADKPNK